MAEMHASADIRNTKRTILAALIAANIGAPIVPDGDERFSSADTDRYVRIRIEPLPGTPAGRVGGKRAQRMPILVFGDCYVRGSAADGTVKIDEVDGLASRVEHALRLANLPLVDYVTDPTGATSVSGVAIRFTQPPVMRTPAPVDGWQRRFVEAPADLFLRHAE